MGTCCAKADDGPPRGANDDSIAVASPTSAADMEVHTTHRVSLDFQVIAQEASTSQGLLFRVGEVLTITRADPRACGVLYGSNDDGEFGFFPSAAVAPFPPPSGRSLTTVGGSEDACCAVCMDPMIAGHMLKPCHHTLCGTCAPAVSKCPQCRARIDSHAPDHATTCAAIAAARYQCDACEVVLPNAFAAMSHECPQSLCDLERERRAVVRDECAAQWDRIMEGFRSLAKHVSVLMAEATARRTLEDAAALCSKLILWECKYCHDELLRTESAAVGSASALPHTSFGRTGT